MMRSLTWVLSALMLTTPALAQDAGAGTVQRSVEVSTTGDVTPSDALEEISDLAAQANAWNEFAEGVSSNDQARQCIGGNAAMLNELAKSAASAATALEAAIAAGNQEKVAREQRALSLALSEARSAGSAAEMCAQSAGVASTDSRLLMKGGAGDPDDDTEKPALAPLSVGVDPADVSPF